MGSELSATPDPTTPLFNARLHEDIQGLQASAHGATGRAFAEYAEQRVRPLYGSRGSEGSPEGNTEQRAL